ncbi:AraC family transcriptional regulator [Persicobacter diffluens]|uniref:HTH araC/xylS-type domain-containing protein n=1 Tax=Persicobacter diffluens TaxID=981 RepID=A0AAN4W1I1_9BACT|nr:hypothetical protein PEDI_46010 [Persicobacter diffluens]
MASTKIPDKGDPSDIQQVFPTYNLQLHCCRYWWLQNWEFKELSFPYWRVYHNSDHGAVVMFKGEEFRLSPDRVILIAPNTAYATRLYDHKIPETGYSLKGGRYNNGGISTESQILHLFIHFNIGMPYDNIVPGIYDFKLSPSLKEKLQIIKRHLNYEHTRFSFNASLAIQSLISELLTEVPEEKWNSKTKDVRILEVINYIENNISDELTNPVLAETAKMATNSFTRLFTDEMEQSPQKYIKTKRIDKACILLHHSGLSIDEIALQTGFSDRYHFSRIFKQVTNYSPAKYRKEYGV